MSQFKEFAGRIEAANNSVIDDETGQTVKLIGVAHLVQRRHEFVVPLFENQDHQILRGMYLDENNLAHIDVFTTGGVLYLDEVDSLTDLQHHPVMHGTIFQTWIFGLTNGGCVPRPAPEPVKKEVKKEDTNKKKGKAKDKEAVKPTYVTPPRRAMGITPVRRPATQAE